MQPHPKLPIGVIASHGGTNLQAIIDACANGSLHAEIRLVISNNSRAFALERARRARIPTAHLSSATHPNPDALDNAITQAMREHGVQIIALAGYMKKLGPRTLSEYENRILNIHPSLLPKFGGPGMYGHKVHAAVLAVGETESGATVHLVTAEYDQGPILAQAKVPVHPNDTPQTLAARILPHEHHLYPQTLQSLATNQTRLDTPVSRPAH